MTHTPPAATGDQERVLALLADPATHGGQGVRRIDTHGAAVFLAGDRAYKLKRSVRYPYMDFSTPERRRAALLEELRLNRRTAPGLYEAVLPVVADDGGHLALGREGTADGAVDWVLVMRRFDEEAVLDRQAERGTLPLEILPALAEAVAAFHERAEVHPECGGVAALTRVTDMNAAQLRAFPALFRAPDVDRWQDGIARRLRAEAALLERRREAGYVRRCHGDLHLRNICVIDGRPTLFDALEFDPSLAITDVLYDLAYLLMDLDHRGRRDGANAVFNRYLEITADYAGLALLPLFLSLRASIRAHVTASAAEGAAAAERPAMLREAARYLAEALDYLAPPPPCLVAVGGLSGTGKTTLARRLAPAVGPVPGAVVLRSDVLRKRMMGVPEQERLPPDGYAEAVTDRVYEEIGGLAGLVLEAGHGVIADAVFAKPAQRAAIRHRAEGAGVSFAGLWLVAALEQQIERVGSRRGDASDATADIVRQQVARDVGEIDWRIQSTAGSPDQVADAVGAWLQRRSG
jgi:aminoglycoside phosphotransferase family enzyme/predicted kinase